MPTALPDVALNDPHVQAHNDERHDINDLITLTNTRLSETYLDQRYLQVRGEVNLPAPTGDATQDDQALTDAINAAKVEGKVIQARSGTYMISTFHDIPDGVDLRGQGGGSTSRSGRTIFKCTTAGAGISISGGGALNGGFEIHGNGTATTPFKRLGGLGANARLFENITVHDNAAGANDLVLFNGAQNDLWIQCGFANSARDLGVFDQGFGGQMFSRCEWRSAGRYHHRYDNQVSGGVYPYPTDVKHIGGIIEGTTAVSPVVINAGANITYSDHAFYTTNAPSGPMVDVKSGLGHSLHNPWIQCTTSVQAGVTGIMARGTASVTVSGRAIVQNCGTGVGVDGPSSFVYANCNWQFYSVTTNFGAINGGTVAQIATVQVGNRLTIGATTDFAEISQPNSRDRFWYSRTMLGAQSWYSGAANSFTPDLTTLRRAPGAWGVQNGTQWVLCTGTGTLAQRPTASSPLNGALYFNTDSSLLEVCNGSAWVPSGSGGTGGAVSSVNTKTGAVVLNATDVGAEPAITAGTTAQYYRGDKTWVTLDKTAVGLPNVDNTSDVNKPISTATQTALNTKANLYTGTTATAQATAAKTATISGYTPTTGDLLALTLTNGNLAAAPTLAINGGSAVSIFHAGVAAPLEETLCSTNSVWLLRYSGTRWDLLGAQTTVITATTAEMQAGALATIRWVSPALINSAIQALAPVKAQSGTITIPTVPGAASGTTVLTDNNGTLSWSAPSSSGPAAPNTQTGTTYTFALTDAEKRVEGNNASAQTFTVPPNSSVAFPIGTRIEVEQYGTGAITLAGPGVTLHYAQSLTTRTQYSVLVLFKRGTDEWIVSGDAL